MGKVYDLPFSPSIGIGENMSGKFRGDRLGELMAEREISQSELARRVGVTQATVWKLLNSSMSGTRYLHKIAAELGTSPAYLMGESEELAGGNARSGEILEIEEFTLAELELEGASEGKLRPFPRAWLEQLTTGPADRLCVVRALGDAMTPTIQSTDSVFIDRSITSPSVSDELFAIRLAGVVSIRRLRPRGAELVIMSDRAEIRDDQARVSEIEILGRVAAIVRNT